MVVLCLVTEYCAINAHKQGYNTTVLIKLLVKCLTEKMPIPRKVIPPYKVRSDAAEQVTPVKKEKFEDRTEELSGYIFDITPQEMLTITRDR